MTEREDSYIAGTLAGGKKAAETNKRKWGSDYYKHIGGKGGKNGKTGGFASEKVDERGMTGRQRAEVFGAIGGRISRRRKKG